MGGDRINLHYIYLNEKVMLAVIFSMGAVKMANNWQRQKL